MEVVGFENKAAGSVTFRCIALHPGDCRCTCKRVQCNAMKSRAALHAAIHIAPASSPVPRREKARGRATGIRDTGNSNR